MATALNTDDGMLLVFRSPFETRKASDYLSQHHIIHRVVLIPESWDYRPEDVAILIDSNDNMDIPMRLSRERIVVMRVFREMQSSDFMDAPDIALTGSLVDED